MVALSRGRDAFAFMLGLVWVSVPASTRAASFPGTLTQVATFEAAVGPLSPLPGSRPNELRLWAVPGQTVTGTIQLDVTRPIENVRVVFSPVVRPWGSRFSAILFDAWILHVWQQAGRGVHVTDPIWTAELMLKDVPETIEDGFAADGTYIPPAVRLTGPPSVSMQPGYPTRFIVRAQIPPAARPGAYWGFVRVVGGDGSVLRAPLRLDVLPIKLVEPRQERLIYYRGTLDPTTRSDYVGESLMVAHLDDIRAHGFTGVTLYDEKPEFLRRAAELARAAGFTGPLVAMARSSAALAAVQDLPGPVFVYGVDEPNTPEKLEQQRQRATAIHAAGQAVMTAIGVASDQQLPPPQDPDSLDVAAYHINNDFFEYLEGLQAGLREKDPRPVWYYWQSMMEKPNLARVLSGFYLWASGLDGIIPYVYQHVPDAPLSPYDESDAWSGTLRMHFTAYPAQGRGIPTIQWEAIRAGIDDLRFIATLEQAIDRAGLTPARDRALVVLARVRELIKPRLAETDPSTREPYQSLRARDYDAMRRQIADAILDLAR
jgi:hypothetical protein